MILGCYYLTVDSSKEVEKSGVYKDVDELYRAHAAELVNYQSTLKNKVDEMNENIKNNH